MDSRHLLELLADNPVIAAVKDDQGLESALAGSVDVIFLLYGNILNLSELVDRVRAAGKAAFVHLDLADGLTNREIAADNKLLKEIKARITRLYNWSKEQSTQPQGRESIMDFLFQAKQDTAPTSRYGKVKALKADAKLFNFLMENGIKSMPELFDKVAAMNGDYYDLRGKIVNKERRISVLTERLEMWAQYQKYKPVRQKLDKVAPAKREQFEQRHSADLALFDAAVHYLDTLKSSGESITPKAWRAEAAKLTAEKDADYLKMRAMREDIKAVETLKKTAERLAREGQTQRREEQER